MSSKIRSIARARDKHLAESSVREIEVTYAQLIGANASGALGALLEQRFPGRLMQMVKLGETVMAELKTLETAKAKLIEQHNGRPNEQTGNYDFGSKAKTKAANDEHRSLLETTVTIRAPRLSDEELEASFLTAAQVLNLMWLVEDSHA